MPGPNEETQDWPPAQRSGDPIQELILAARAVTEAWQPGRPVPFDPIAKLLIATAQAEAVWNRIKAK